jgi:hypothetical protein
MGGSVGEEVHDHEHDHRHAQQPAQEKFAHDRSPAPPLRLGGKERALESRIVN